MVQVDVFWSFALGAGFAAAASRQIKHDDEKGDFKLGENKYFTKNLVYLACLFAPSGLYLLWQFTGWETMYFWTGQVKTGLYRYERALPAWLVVMFAITNVTQGILGFWWASVYIRRNRIFAANLLWLAGYFGMFFILVHGWDGNGYVRFFTIDLDQWDSMYNPATGVVTHGCALWMAIKWAATAPVAWTLYAMGVIMMPPMFYWLTDWIKTGYQLSDRVDRDRAHNRTRLELTIGFAKLVFLHALTAAIAASLIIRLMSFIFGGTLGFVIGAMVSFAGFYSIGLKPGGLTRRALSEIYLDEV